MGDLFTYKTRLLLLQTVSGHGPLTDHSVKVLGDEHVERLMRNKERFHALPQATKDLLERLHAKWQKQLQKPFLEQTYAAISRIVFSISLWEQTWIALAIATSILLLLKIEGAVAACWLLPFITLCYSVDAYSHTKSQFLAPDEALFPTEEVIFSKVLKEEPKASAFAQKEQLQRGWEEYLLKEWSSEQAPIAKSERKNAIEQAEFDFYVARLELMALYPPSGDSKNQPFPVILAYFFWNLFFAWQVHRVMQSGNGASNVKETTQRRKDAEKIGDLDSAMHKTFSNP
jgi:hypothetical protein